MTDYSDIFICIPAYDAATTLVELIAGITEHLPGAPIVVVDDGSPDATAGLLPSLDVHALTHKVNRGKGAALATAFDFVIAHGGRAAIQIDADLQHEPCFLSDFTRRFATGDWDVLIGTRDFTPGIMPWERRLTNRLTSRIVSWLAGCHIDDSQSGYRLLSRAVLETIRPETTGYEYEPEHLILAGRAGFRIGAVPISTVYEGSASYIHPLKDTWRFVRLAASYKFGRNRKKGRSRTGRSGEVLTPRNDCGSRR